MLVMWFAPKIATVIDVLTRPTRAARSAATGGSWRASLSETIFFILLSPIMWFGHTLFLAGLLFGRSVGWGAQARDDHAVSLAFAARAAVAADAARAAAAFALLATTRRLRSPMRCSSPAAWCWRSRSR